MRGSLLRTAASARNQLLSTVSVKAFNHKTQIFYLVNCHKYLNLFNYSVLQNTHFNLHLSAVLIQQYSAIYEKQYGATVHAHIQIHTCSYHHDEHIMYPTYNYTYSIHR